MACEECGTQIDGAAGACPSSGVQATDRSIPPFSSFSKWGISKSEVTLPCTLSTTEVDDRMCDLSQHGVSFTLVGRNVLADGFEYSLKSGVGLCSWGELVYVKCTAAQAGSFVNIFSKCAFPLQVIAWGKHDRNIDAIKGALDIS